MLRMRCPAPPRRRCAALPAPAPAVARRTWKGGSHGRFCMTGSAKVEGACTMSKVTCTSAAWPDGSGADTSRSPSKAAVSGAPGTRA